MARSLWDWNWDDPFMLRSDWESPYLRLRTAMDQVFEDFGREYPALGAWGTSFRASFPRINVRETAEGFMLKAEVPGLRMNDFEITCRGRDLTLRGEMKGSGESEEAYVRRERPMGTFMRTFTLPAEVDADKVTATLADGILQIAVPKAESAKPRRIEVKASGTGVPGIEGTATQKTEPEEAKK